MLARRTLFAVVVFALALAVAPARGADDPLKGLDEYIQSSMKDWGVPGLAVAVVKDDQVVLARGFGVRKLGESNPVDEKTIFAIASCSKAFTAAAIAILVDEGKLKWDDPVTKYLPQFQMSDPAVTREITIRDLLCHRCGLARHDQIWYDSGAGRDEILRRVRYAPLKWSFRSQFGYQNIMFLAAGQVVQAVTGQTWDDFVKARFFTPLGMTDSSSSTKDLSGRDNVASPHVKIDDQLESVPWRNIDNAGPAGSINSNVTDMARWLRLQLGRGTFEKTALISENSIREMHKPQTVMNIAGMGPEGKRWEIYNTDANFPSYGLGWMLRDFRGKKVCMHGGSIDGMNSWVALLPDERLGVVVLTNFNPNLLMAAVSYRVFDAYLGASPRDWSGEFHNKLQPLLDAGKEADKKREKERVADTKPSLPLAKYAGTYHTDQYGDVTVSLENDKLMIRHGGFRGELQHWHFDTFRGVWTDRTHAKSFVTFVLNERGSVAELKSAEFDDLPARRTGQ